MTSSVRLALLGAAVMFAACSDPFEPMSATAAPDSVAATPLGMRSVQLTWVRSANAVGYVIERRANLVGSFAPVKQLSSGFVTRFTDDSLSPETIYGYRVRAVAATGGQSGPSLVVVARTAPVPGIVASVSTAPLELADPSGYTVSVAGASDSLQAGVGPLDQHRFGPLAPGIYRVWLSHVPASCTVSGGAQQTDTVTDQGLRTLQYASFNVSCRDPHVGRLSVHVTTSGDSVDADGYQLTLSGVADDTSLPDSARAYFKRDNIGVQALDNFESLRPGAYTLELSGVAGNCTVGGTTSQTVQVHALDDLTKSFAVTCHGVEDLTRPLVWRSTWSTAAASKGQHVSLQVGLDLRARPAEDVNAVQADLFFDSTVVRYDSASAPTPWQPTVNAAARNRLSWLSFVTGQGQKDSVALIRFFFTVVGDSGTSTTVRDSLEIVSDFVGNDLIPLTRRVEGTLTVGGGSGGGGGGGTNQAPTSRPGGPYSGTAGSAISFNGGASSDPDGSIARYAWTFGDGATGSGATPTHTYSAAGSYTVTLVVTDNEGLTGSATTTATVTAGGGGGNLPPTANANGPYSGTAGSAVNFGSAGSTDPDGTIATFAWTCGDGATGTGPSPSHTYSAAGTYTVTLTVTDNLGATGSASTSATIASSGSSKPFTWRNDFGPVSAVDSLVTLTVTLDLSTDIPQTSGAEADTSWRVDSLKWDPAVLKYFSFNFGPGAAGSVNPTDALSRGKLVFNGVQAPSFSTGLITIATIKFKVIGASGATTTTTTALGTLLGTGATGSFSYGSYTAVVEGTVHAP